MKSVFRLILCCLIAFQPVYAQETTLDAINRVIDKIMAETDFELTVKTQQASETVQSVQFSNFNSQSSSAFFYAFSFVECAEAGIYSLGFAAKNQGEIFVNSEKIFTSNANSGFWFSEFAYDRYNFPNKTQAFFKKGRNTVLIKSTTAKSPAFYLAVLENNAEISPKLKFTSAPYSQSESSNWLICFTNDSLLHKYTSPVNAVHSTWFTPEIPLISKLMAGSNASFKKHSYVEWQYSNGATLWSILNFAGTTQNTVYEDFVKKCCDFNIRNYEKFKTQYFQLNEIHGYNHRLYRLQMLDDSSAPALPYLKLYTENKLTDADFILKKVEDFVVNKQTKLSDGTFCRPEPWNESIWADDLFMSAPYLMMLGKSTGNPKYYDDAAFQVISYYKHLYDKKTGLCRHGWVNSPAKDSIPYWSRANGWMIWATSEVLLNLPESHKDYKTIQNIFVAHVSGLLKWQNNDGFLHQLLNDPNSFTETSSTAMLTIALARGVNNGWLPKKYKKQALKSWNAVLSRIETDGNVKGICEGTSISAKSDYYLNRRTMDHDPRGLGAVITAGLEIMKLEAYLAK